MRGGRGESLLFSDINFGISFSLSLNYLGGRKEEKKMNVNICESEKKNLFHESMTSSFRSKVALWKEVLFCLWLFFPSSWCVSAWWNHVMWLANLSCGCNLELYFRIILLLLILPTLMLHCLCDIPVPTPTWPSWKVKSLQSAEESTYTEGEFLPMLTRK